MYKLNNLWKHFLRPGKQDMISNKWDLTGPIPTPLFMPQCSVCGGKNTLLFRRMDIHEAQWSPIYKYRARYWMKCGDNELESGCGALVLFGIPIPEEMYKNLPQPAFTRHELITYLKTICVSDEDVVFLNMLQNVKDEAGDAGEKDV